MTALAGLWRFDGQPTAAEDCDRMLSAQAIYGPDATARWTHGDVALGRALMRVLPEDEYDRQPLIGAGGRFALVADLRIDNRDELSDALGISAMRAATLSDAAILLAALERWEEAALDRLVGEYAFALWDDRDRRFSLARDPLGQRTLHFHRSKHIVAFSSMPQGLHALPEVPVAADEERIAEFLTLMPEPRTRTFFVGVERVEPGHIVTVTAAGVSARKYWQPRIRPLTLRGPDDYAEALREHLDRAVRSQLRGVQHVAVALSGGLDSTAVAATAARLLAPSGGRVTGFTSVPREGFEFPDRPGRIIDEGPLAAATAAMYPNMDHVLVRTTGLSPLADLDRVFRLCQRPVLNICNIGWVNAINETAERRGMSVLLSGDAGNSGMSYGGWPLLPELFCSGRWVRWWRAARALRQRRRLRWPYLMAQTVGPWVPGAIWLWFLRARRGFDFDVFAHSAINPSRLANLDRAGRARDTNQDLAFRPAKDSVIERLWSLSSADPGNYKKAALGGWRIDVRDPTADLRLIEFCLAVPTGQFLHEGVPRALALRALADRLPKVVLEEKRSGLQAADWFERLTMARTDVAAEIDRLAACPAAVRLLDLPRLRRLVENWPTAGWGRPEVNSEYRSALLRAISAGHFLRSATTRAAGATAGAEARSELLQSI